MNFKILRCLLKRTGLVRWYKRLLERSIPSSFEIFRTFWVSLLTLAVKRQVPLLVRPLSRHERVRQRPHQSSFVDLALSQKQNMWLGRELNLNWSNLELFLFG